MGSINEKETEQIISCFGSACDFCSFLDSLSNIYNIFLALSFFIALFVLVLAGFRYIFNQDEEAAVINKKRIKMAIIGFGVVILGWLIIGTTFRILGYQNAGNWYEINCETENSKIKNTRKNVKEGYKDLPVYKELKDFLSSGEAEALIEGPTLSPVLQKQISDLSSGQILYFLAPTQTSSQENTDDLFLPLITVKKDGDGVNLESFGQYFDLLESEYSSFPSDNKTLNTLLKNSKTEEKGKIVNASGEVLDGSDLKNLYSKIAEILKDQNNEENQSLNEMLVKDAIQKDDSELDRIIAILVSETIRTSEMVMVKRQDSSEILTDSQLKCQLSSGLWEEGKCQCPENSVLIKDICKVESDLEKKCEKSGGIWENVSKEYSPTISCGFLEGDSDINPYIEDSYQKADRNQVESGSYYCKCPEGACVDEEGKCQKQEEDSDGDKILNSRDRCPNTEEQNILGINKKEGSQYFGCSCEDIALKSKNCPPDQCIGDYLNVYPKGNQDCFSGEPVSYTCSPEIQRYSENCASQNKKGNSNSNSKNNQEGKGSGSNDKIKDDFFGKQGGKGTDIGENKLGPGGGMAMYSKPEGVKAALRRIHEKDPLRYEMIFRYVSKIAPTSFSGGLCYGCGYIEVNYGLPLKMLDQVIVHEASHSGHFCRGMSESTAEVERIAVGNEIGSLERLKTDDKGREIKYPMDEFQRQSQEINYKNILVRGYLSRFMQDVDPKGDLIPADYHWAINYALSYGDNTKGPNHYGYPEKGYLLGLKDKEENKIKSIMSMEDFPCKTKPPSDLPEVPACKNARDELQLGR